MKIIQAILLIIICWPATAQKQVQNFSLTNVADDTSLSLHDFNSMKGIVVIFTSNSCPYDGYYEERIRILINNYQEKIQFLLINSHTNPDESVEKMKSSYNSWNLSVPYLADKEQVAMNALGARKSPEAFLLKIMNGKYTLVYSGAIDDNPQMANAVSRPYLKTAVDHLLAGSQQENTLSSRTVGCTIRGK